MLSWWTLGWPCIPPVPATFVKGLPAGSPPQPAWWGCQPDTCAPHPSQDTPHRGGSRRLPEPPTPAGIPHTEKCFSVENGLYGEKWQKWRCNKGWPIFYGQHQMQVKSLNVSLKLGTLHSQAEEWPVPVSILPLAYCSWPTPAVKPRHGRGSRRLPGPPAGPEHHLQTAGAPRQAGPNEQREHEGFTCSLRLLRRDDDSEKRTGWLQYERYRVSRQYNGK